MTNQPKKPKKPSPRRLTEKMAGCSSGKYDCFIDKYYPGKNHIPITEENFYRWCKLRQECCANCEANHLVWVLSDRMGSNKYPIQLNPGDFSDLSILACIFALQVQGVFR